MALHTGQTKYRIECKPILDLSQNFKFLSFCLPKGRLQ